MFANSFLKFDKVSVILQLTVADCQISTTFQQHFNNALIEIIDNL